MVSSVPCTVLDRSSSETPPMPEQVESTPVEKHAATFPRQVPGTMG